MKNIGNIKLTVLLGLAISLVACGDSSSPRNGTGATAGSLAPEALGSRQKKVGETVKKVVLAILFVAGSLGCVSGNADAKKKVSPAWEIVYTGDLAGKISGSVTAVAGASSSTAIRGATPVLGGETFNGSVFLPVGQIGPATIAPFSMTLANGTKCVLKAETRLRANVKNGQRKTYHIEFEGPLDCDGKAIKIEGFLKD